MKEILVLSLVLISLILLVKPVLAKEEGLVLYFKFDELDGDKLVDHSGMENHGTVFGEYEEVEGKINGGIQMDGSKSNYVEVADADSLDLTEVYTMAVWVKFAEITGQRHQFFFDKGADDKNPGGWRLGKLQSGHLRFQIYKDGAWAPPFDLKSPGFEPDEWYHTAVTRDEKGITNIYLNGEVGATNETDTCILPKNENALIVWGSTKWGTNNMFTGVMDELAIFNGRTLTQSEIRTFMESGTSSVEPADKLAILWGKIRR